MFFKKNHAISVLWQSLGNYNGMDSKSLYISFTGMLSVLPQEYHSWHICNYAKTLKQLVYT